MIQNFISEIKNKSLARTNRFLVQFAPVWASQSDISLISLYCYATILPALDISSHPVRIYGESREMPYERTFSPITLSFYVDGDMRVKKLFDEWMSMIINPTTRVVSYFKSYVCPISISVLGVDESKKLYEITLVDAWPKSMGGVSLDQTSRDVMKLPVTFSYKSWHTTATRRVSSVGGGGASNGIDGARGQGVDVGAGGGG